MCARTQLENQPNFSPHYPFRAKRQAVYTIVLKSAVYINQRIEPKFTGCEADSRTLRRL